MMRIVFLGRSVPSSFVQALERLGNEVVRLEAGRYRSLAELDGLAPAVVDADLVVVDSDVDNAVADWVLENVPGVSAFWDLDLSRLQLATGRAEPFHPMVDTEQYFPAVCAAESLLGYLGRYRRDRQGQVDSLLLEPARRLPDERFVVAGAQFPPSINWPSNVVRIEHVPPGRQRQFYATQSFALNVSSGELRSTFEAAACCTPIVTSDWKGLSAFFEPGREVFVANSADEAYEVLIGVSPAERRAVARRARRRVLTEHTADHRARQLERLVHELRH